MLSLTKRARMATSTIGPEPTPPTRAPPPPIRLSIIMHSFSGASWPTSSPSPVAIKKKTCTTPVGSTALPAGRRAL